MITSSLYLKPFINMILEIPGLISLKIHMLTSTLAENAKFKTESGELLPTLVENAKFKAGSGALGPLAVHQVVT